MSTPSIITWPTIIISSVSQHFVNALGGTPLIFEGELPKEDFPFWVEFRRIGPHFRLMSEGFYKLTLTVDLAIMEVIADIDNVYNIDNIVGELLPHFDKIIVGEGDNYLGCLNKVSEVQIKPWGRLGRNSLVKQTTMNAKFVIEIKENA